MRLTGVRLSRKTLIKAYLAYCLCMDCDVFIRLFGGLSGSATNIGGFQSANPVLLMFSALLVGGTAVLALPVYRRIARVLVNSPWMTGLYLWCLLSICWALEPGTVVRLGLPLWAYMLSGVIASFYLSIEEVVGVVGNLMSFIALASAIWERLDPIRDSAAPGWTGVFGEKNHLGMGMGVGLIALLAAPRGAVRWRGVKIALCAVLLVGSQSATAMIFTVVAATLYGLFKTPARLRPLATAILLACVAVPFVVSSHAVDRAFALSGKSTTFTGRDVIWSFVVEQWQTRPLLGYGYGNFWGTQDSLIQQTLHWNPNSAHNGFLEILVTLGGVGEIWLMGTLVSGIVLARKAWRAGHRTAAIWLCMAWLAMMIDDLTEADFIVPAPLWFTYCLVFFCTYAEMRRCRVTTRVVVLGESSGPLHEALAGV